MYKYILSVFRKALFWWWKFLFFIKVSCIAVFLKRGVFFFKSTFFLTVYFVRFRISVRLRSFKKKLYTLFKNFLSFWLDAPVKLKDKTADFSIDEIECMSAREILENKDFSYQLKENALGLPHGSLRRERLNKMPFSFEKEKLFWELEDTLREELRETPDLVKIEALRARLAEKSSKKARWFSEVKAAFSKKEHASILEEERLKEASLAHELKHKKLELEQAVLRREMEVRFIEEKKVFYSINSIDDFFLVISVFLGLVFAKLVFFCKFALFRFGSILGFFYWFFWEISQSFQRFLIYLKADNQLFFLDNFQFFFKLVFFFKYNFFFLKKFLFKKWVSLFWLFFFLFSIFYKCFFSLIYYMSEFLWYIYMYLHILFWRVPFFFFFLLNVDYYLSFFFNWIFWCLYIFKNFLLGKFFVLRRRHRAHSICRSSISSYKKLGLSYKHLELFLNNLLFYEWRSHVYALYGIGLARFKYNGSFLYKSAWTFEAFSGMFYMKELFIDRMYAYLSRAFTAYAFFFYREAYFFHIFYSKYIEYNFNLGLILTTCLWSKRFFIYCFFFAKETCLFIPNYIIDIYLYKRWGRYFFFLVICLVSLFVGGMLVNIDGIIVSIILCFIYLFFFFYSFFFFLKSVAFYFLLTSYEGNSHATGAALSTTSRGYVGGEDALLVLMNSLYGSAVDFSIIYNQGFWFLFCTFYRFLNYDWWWFVAVNIIESFEVNGGTLGLLFLVCSFIFSSIDSVLSNFLLHYEVYFSSRSIAFSTNFGYLFYYTWYSFVIIFPVWLQEVFLYCSYNPMFIFFFWFESFFFYFFAFIQSIGVSVYSLLFIGYTFVYSFLTLLYDIYLYIEFFLNFSLFFKEFFKNNIYFIIVIPCKLPFYLGFELVCQIHDVYQELFNVFVVFFFKVLFYIREHVVIPIILDFLCRLPYIVDYLFNILYFLNIKLIWLGHFAFVLCFNIFNLCVFCIAALCILIIMGTSYLSLSLHIYLIALITSSDIISFFLLKDLMFYQDLFFFILNWVSYGYSCLFFYCYIVPLMFIYSSLMQGLAYIIYYIFVVPLYLLCSCVVYMLYYVILFLFLEIKVPFDILFNLLVLFGNLFGNFFGNFFGDSFFCICFLLYELIMSIGTFFYYLFYNIFVFFLKNVVFILGNVLGPLNFFTPENLIFFFEPWCGASVVFSMFYYYILLFSSWSFSYVVRTFNYVHDKYVPPPPVMWREEIKRLEPDPTYHFLDYPHYKLFFLDNLLKHQNDENITLFKKSLEVWREVHISGSSLETAERSGIFSVFNTSKKKFMGSADVSYLPKDMVSLWQFDFFKKHDFFFKSFRFIFNFWLNTLRLVYVNAQLFASFLWGLYIRYSSFGDLFGEVEDVTYLKLEGFSRRKLFNQYVSFFNSMPTYKVDDLYWTSFMEMLENKQAFKKYIYGSRLPSQVLSKIKMVDMRQVRSTCSSRGNLYDNPVDMVYYVLDPDIDEDALKDLIDLDDCLDDLWLYPWLPVLSLFSAVMFDNGVYARVLSDIDFLYLKNYYRGYPWNLKKGTVPVYNNIRLPHEAQIELVKKITFQLSREYYWDYDEDDEAGILDLYEFSSQHPFSTWQTALLALEPEASYPGLLNLFYGITGVLVYEDDSDMGFPNGAFASAAYRQLLSTNSIYGYIDSKVLGKKHWKLPSGGARELSGWTIYDYLNTFYPARLASIGSRAHAVVERRFYYHEYFDNIPTDLRNFYSKFVDCKKYIYHSITRGNRVLERKDFYSIYGLYKNSLFMRKSIYPYNFVAQTDINVCPSTDLSTYFSVALQRSITGFIERNFTMNYYYVCGADIMKRFEHNLAVLNEASERSSSGVLYTLSIEDRLICKDWFCVLPGINLPKFFIKDSSNMLWRKEYLTYVLNYLSTKDSRFSFKWNTRILYKPYYVQLLDLNSKIPCYLLDGRRNSRDIITVNISAVHVSLKPFLYTERQKFNYFKIELPYRGLSSYMKYEWHSLGNSNELNQGSIFFKKVESDLLENKGDFTPWLDYKYYKKSTGSFFEGFLFWLDSQRFFVKVYFSRKNFFFKAYKFFQKVFTKIKEFLYL